MILVFHFFKLVNLSFYYFQCKDDDIEYPDNIVKSSITSDDIIFLFKIPSNDKIKIIVEGSIKEIKFQISNFNLLPLIGLYNNFENPIKIPKTK